MMGILINSSCTLWQYTCGNRGSCWLYEILTYRYMFVGSMAALKFASLISHTAVYISIKPEKVKIVICTHCIGITIIYHLHNSLRKSKLNTFRWSVITNPKSLSKRYPKCDIRNNYWLGKSETFRISDIETYSTASFDIRKVGLLSEIINTFRICLSDIRKTFRICHDVSA